jgi:hypothetical protein
VRVWTYVIDEPVHACDCHPITQTYLDVVLAGCLEYGAHAASRFLDTTDGWERTLINDRHEPIFTRGLRNAPHTVIDRLLAEKGLSRKD